MFSLIINKFDYCVMGHLPNKSIGPVHSIAYTIKLHSHAMHAQLTINDFIAHFVYQL